MIITLNVWYRIPFASVYLTKPVSHCQETIEKIAHLYGGEKVVALFVVGEYLDCD